MLLLHEQLLAAGIVPLVPAVVLAQAWRGGPQPLLSRFLRGLRIVDDREADARAAGRACALSRTSDVVDALVVVLALRLGAVVLTSDPDDLTHLAASLDAAVTVRGI